jgi:hypothetical protein
LALLASRQIPMTELPVARRRDWAEWIDQPLSAAEEAALQPCLQESRPFGRNIWIDRIKNDHGWREPPKRGMPSRRRGREAE